jgi:hypothetical protein
MQLRLYCFDFDNSNCHRDSNCKEPLTLLDLGFLTWGNPVRLGLFLEKLKSNEKIFTWKTKK